MPHLSLALATISSAIAPHSISERVRRKAGLCLLDFLAACADGAGTAIGRQALMTARLLGGRGTCALIGTTGTTSPAEAVFANAVVAGSTAQMDTLADSASHPGVVIIPALLAAAGMREATGESFLTAMVAAYEVMGRLGGTMYADARQFVARPTGILGPIGAAVAVARQWGLTTAQTAHAIGLAANSSAGLMEWTTCGTTEFIFHAGTAARNGLTACQLAAAGAEAAPSTLEGESGLLKTFAPTADTTRIAGPEGQGFQIERVSHKPAPACIYVQSPCQAALAITRHPDFALDRINGITIDVHPTAMAYPGCDNGAAPQTAQEARMSIQFSVAAVLANGAISARNWRLPYEAGLVDIMTRCRLQSTHASDVSRGGARSCAITIQFASGRMIREVRSDLEPMTTADIEDRFRLAWSGRIAEASIGQVLAWSSDLRQLRNVGELSACVSDLIAEGDGLATR